MDEFARLSSTERRLYFEQTAARLGLSAQIIEKDFWVCWSLKRLFSLDEFQECLTFKGGTSLSKVYRVIERFSEDVDLAIDRDFLGFGGDQEPEKGQSGKEQQRRIDRLREACQTAIRDRLEPQLHEIIAAELGGDAGWHLIRDDADKDGQTLLFQYPPAIGTGLSPYFSASVKIEFGARSDHFPVEAAAITPYLSDAFPDALSNRAARVRVLGAERTFWEKATILHMLHHYPVGKTVSPRMSRHYYDVFQLAESSVWDKALAAMDLLDRVAVHKSIFFKAAWAEYPKAVRGTLRLMPGERILGTLEQDYEAMRPMFFGEAPTFGEILTRLAELESRINGTTK